MVRDEQAWQATLLKESFRFPVGELLPIERRLVDLINKERTLRGLAPLRVHMRLVGLARLKSREMARQGYFSHISPTMGSPAEMFQAAGLPHELAAENIADSVELPRVHHLFMGSPGHRKNLLASTLTHVGVGLSRRAGRRHGVTAELFMGDGTPVVPEPAFAYSLARYWRNDRPPGERR